MDVAAAPRPRPDSLGRTAAAHFVSTHVRRGPRRTGPERTSVAGPDARPSPAPTHRPRTHVRRGPTPPPRFVGEPLWPRPGLWHATFGPKTCHPSEFTNTRVGAAAEGGADSHEYDEAPLDGFRDRFDGPLYDRAAQLFWAAVAKKDLDREFCDDWKAACLKHAAEHPTPEPPPRPRAEATPGIEVLIGSCLASLSAVVFCVVGAQLMVRRRRRSAVADEIEMESFLQREQGLG